MVVVLHVNPHRHHVRVKDLYLLLDQFFRTVLQIHVVHHVHVPMVGVHHVMVVALVRDVNHHVLTEDVHHVQEILRVVIQQEQNVACVNNQVTV